MQRLIILAFGLAIVLCFTTQVTANDKEQFVEDLSDIKNAELSALLDADAGTGVHDNQSGREARQFFNPFFGGGFGRRPFGGGFGRRPFGGGFGGGFGRRPFGGGFGRRRIIRRHRRRGGFFG